MKRRSFRRRWLAPGSAVWHGLFAVTCMAVLVLGLLPASASLPTVGWDKSNHFSAFAVLGWLGRLSWPHRTRKLLVGLLVYGALIEVLQSFTPDRVGEIEDLLADSVGLFFGVGLCSVMASKLTEDRLLRD